VPSSANGSVVGSMPGRILENALRGVLGSVLTLDLTASRELFSAHKSSRLGVYNQMQSGVYFRAY